MLKMNRWILVFFFLTIFASSLAFAQAFQSKATQLQISLIARDLHQEHNNSHPECPFIDIASMQFIEKKDVTTYEKWVVEACSGRKFPYLVKYIQVLDDEAGIMVMFDPITE